MNLARLMAILMCSNVLKCLALLKSANFDSKYFGKTSMDIHDKTFQEFVPSFILKQYKVVDTNYNL